jgi:exodeoxyribonuclease VII small subunit
MTKKTQTYAGAIAEMEEIISQMESGELEIDDLSDKVKKATDLIRFCRTKLKQTERTVTDILEDDAPQE